MTYDIALVPPRLQHMPPAALALAILLHVLIGAAIWWLAPLQPAEPEDQPIMVMFDSTPSNVGLQAPEKAGPAAESRRASPQQPSTEPQREEQQQQALAPPQPSTTPEPPQPAPPSEAKPEPEQVPSLPIFEFSVPPRARAAAAAHLARLSQAAGAPSAAPAGAAHAAAAAAWRHRRRNGRRPRRPRPCRRRCPGPIRATC